MKITKRFKCVNSDVTAIEVKISDELTIIKYSDNSILITIDKLFFKDEIVLDTYTTVDKLQTLLSLE